MMYFLVTVSIWLTIWIWHVLYRVKSKWISTKYHLRELTNSKQLNAENMMSGWCTEEHYQYWTVIAKILFSSLLLFSSCWLFPISLGGQRGFERKYKLLPFTNSLLVENWINIYSDYIDLHIDTFSFSFFPPKLPSSAIANNVCFLFFHISLCWH